LPGWQSDAFGRWRHAVERHFGGARVPQGSRRADGRWAHDRWRHWRVGFIIRPLAVPIDHSFLHRRPCRSSVIWCITRRGWEERRASRIHCQSSAKFCVLFLERFHLSSQSLEILQLRPDLLKELFLSFAPFFLLVKTCNQPGARFMLVLSSPCQLIQRLRQE